MKLPSIRGEPDPEEAPTGNEGAEILSPPTPIAPRSPIAYLVALWRGEIPLSQVFWRDMVCVGTAINLAAMGLAILAVVLGVSTPAGIAIHLSPIPYNIFLVTAVWKRAEIERSEWGWGARLAAILWLLVAFVI